MGKKPFFYFSLSHQSLNLSQKQNEKKGEKNQKQNESEIFSCSAIEIDSIAITQFCHVLGSCLISFLLRSTDRLTHKCSMSKMASKRLK